MDLHRGNGLQQAVPPPVHFGSIDYFKYEFQQTKPIGADNDKYLKEVGYTEEEINTMRQRGLVV